MIKVLILAGDKIENEIKTLDNNGRFIFIIRGEEVFYLDTSIGKLWKTTLPHLLENKACLGEGHRKILQEHFSELANNG